MQEKKSKAIKRWGTEAIKMLKIQIDLNKFSNFYKDPCSNFLSPPLSQSFC